MGGDAKRKTNVDEIVEFKNSKVFQSMGKNYGLG
jgi:tetrahydromethanopterin S-methyltransferase subunit G